MAKSIIKFTKTRNVELPARSHAHDAGIDFFVPKFDPTFIADLKLKNADLFVAKGTLSNQLGSLTLSGLNAEVQFEMSDENNTIFRWDEDKEQLYFLLSSLSRVNIPSGIYCQMEEADRALIAANKSGIASREGLIFGAQVVDFEYQGEIHINIINTSSKVVRIYEGQKLIQFLETPIFISDIEEVDSIQNLYKGATSRADGGFGSTDK